MALTINNQASGGLIAPQVTSGSLPPQKTPPLQAGTLNLAPAPVSTSLTGLLPVNHPAPGSLGTPVSHTTTSAPDGTTTTKVQYADPAVAATEENPTPAAQPTPNQNTTFPGLVTSTAGAAGSQLSTAQQEQAIGAQYAPKFEALLPQVRAGSPAALNAFGGASVLSGLEENAAQTASAEANTLSQAEQAALAPLTASQTAQAGATSGFQGAATVTQPSETFPYVFDPVSGSFTNTGGGVITPTQAADAVLNNQMTYDQAVSSLGYLPGGTGSAQLQSSILAKNPNANITNLQAQGTVQQGQQTQIQQWTSSLQQAQNLQSQLSDLITSFGLNPNDVNAANSALQTIATNVSDPRYQALNSYLADIASVYSNILTPPGGSQTDTTRSIASGLLNGTSQGQSIIAQMKVLDNQANAKIAGVSTIGSSSTLSQNSGTSGTSGSGTITTTAADGNDYSFHQDANGNWVAN